MNERVIAPEYAPEKNVQLKNGLLFNAFENNKSYLKKHFTLDDLSFPFRDRIGQECPRSRPLAFFWETDLEGSNAGRFLMGAGNALCYSADDELKKEMDALIHEIMRGSRRVLHGFPKRRFYDSGAGELYPILVDPWPFGGIPQRIERSGGSDSPVPGLV